MSVEIYSRTLTQLDDFNQVRMTISEFNNIEYIHIRKYYLGFEEEWLPTKDGISFPLSLENSKELFIGLLEILAMAESKELIIENFKELINE